VTISLVHPHLYTPAMGLAALILTPVRWVDPLTVRSPQKDRIPAGYYCIARKQSGA
jgi:hypothetical protein